MRPMRIYGFNAFSRSCLEELVRRDHAATGSDELLVLLEVPSREYLQKAESASSPKLCRARANANATTDSRKVA